MSDEIRVNLKIKQKDHPQLHERLAQLNPMSRAEFLRRAALMGMMSEAGISGIPAISNAPVARTHAPVKPKKEIVISAQKVSVFEVAKSYWHLA